MHFRSNLNYPQLLHHFIHSIHRDWLKMSIFTRVNNAKITIFPQGKYSLDFQSLLACIYTGKRWRSLITICILLVPVDARSKLNLHRQKQRQVSALMFVIVERLCLVRFLTRWRISTRSFRRSTMPKRPSWIRCPIS